MRRIGFRRWRPHGYAMGFYAVFIATVAMPLLVLSVDLVRLLAVRTRLQTAADAACQSAVAAVTAPVFQGSKQVVLSPSAALANAYREFYDTARDAGLVGYHPSVQIGFVGPATAVCQATASLDTLVPGAPPMGVTVLTVSMARDELSP